MSTEHPTPARAAASTLRARTAVGAVFFGNGLIFSSLVARVPDVRSGLGLDNGALGLLLLSIAVGSLVALPTSGRLIDRWSASAVVRWGAVVAAAGLVAATIGVVDGSVPLTAAGLVVLGGGSGAWDVAMNVEGAEVERRLGRTIMPRFHAGFSLGTVAGAGLAVLVIAAGVSLTWHLLSVAVITAAAVVRCAYGLPAGGGRARRRHGARRPLGLARAAHARRRAAGAGLRGRRGHRPTTGSPSRSSTGTRPARRSGSRATRCSSAR